MRLDDFFHLPAVTDAFARLMQDQAGLIVIAGLDLLPLKGEAESTLLPSGRTTIFRVLAETLLQSGDAPAALVAVDGHAFRPPRAQRRRLTVWRVPPHEPYAAYVAQAIAQGARLLLVDHLTVETSTAIVAALRAGMQVITQITSAARGVTLVREIEQLGVADHQLPDRFWVLNIRRLAQLCPACRKSQPITPLQRLTLTAVGRPGLDPDASYSVAAGCDHCQRLGRVGSVALFDIGRLERCANGAMHFEAVLALEQYARELALQGVLAFDDVVDLDAVMNRQLTQQFALHQQTLAQTNQVLERRLVELQHANEVLEQRTAAMISFQTIGQALISSTNLHDLAQRVCRHVCELCHADRAVFYMFDPAQQALILAVSGWDAAYVGRAVAGSQLLTRKHEPRAFKGWPPGIPAQHADVLGGELRAGLCVPLIAEHQQVGMVLIHTMSRRRFAPGEIALLQTFAHQAALLIQRTRLLDDLRTHIVRLQEAQAALVEQERIAREMELAAEVQRSILPQVYPAMPGLGFAALNRPARMVGGDFYDIFALDATNVGVVIADVSGKGIAAALYMALTRSLVFAEAQRERSPREVLLNVNRLLRAVGDPQMFVTVFYGVINTESRELIYARAGHDYPLHMHGERLELLAGRGLVLGILDVEAEQLSEERIILGAGDRLILYTDGLTDVLDPHNRRLELPGLIAILQEQRHASPAQICAATFAALQAYQGAAEQFDDMTLVVVGVGGA